MRSLVRWLAPTLALAAVIGLLIQLSSLLAGREFGLGAYTSIQFVLNTNAAALASTLGILIAIVLLMVQLTAQRYSFNIIGQFVKNPRNVSLVALFILTISFNLWLAASVDDGYIPQFGTYLALGLGTLCFGLLIPYFGYLFDSLSPHTLLEALQAEAVRAINTARRNRALEASRRVAAENVQHVGDITRTAVSLSDTDVARYSVWMLYGIFCDYLGWKAVLPRGWFAVEDRYFRGRHAMISKELEESGTWFERRILEELQAAFTSSLNRLEPVNTTVALACRLAGERALERSDEAALRLVMKFFNTFLRAALNARDARAGYHLMYQYALLADAAFESRPEIAQEITHRLTYYGETSLGAGVLWMAIAAAQDLRSLAEASSRRGMAREVTSDIQKELLHLVGEAQAKQSPAASLLEKAVIALGAFHLDQGEDGLARELAAGLVNGSAGHLENLAQELASVTESDFWELTDRGVNFEYVEEGPRRRLQDFLALIRPPGEPSDQALGRLASLTHQLEQGRPR